MKNADKNIPVFAISGVKNSGKTTLITQLLPLLSAQGVRIAVVKHDGHDFDADVPGTDTYRHLHAGAYGTAIYSDSKYMVVKEKMEKTNAYPDESQFRKWFPEADLILLEGFKRYPCPKLEVIRKGNSQKSICKGRYLTAIATDFPPEEQKDFPGDIPCLDLNNPQKIAAWVLKHVLESRANFHHDKNRRD